MLTGKDLEKLLPQSYPMIMIDTLATSDEKKTETLLTVKENNIFVSEGKLREPGIIENMAQTAAARAGYEAKIKNKKVKAGFIGNIKNLNIFNLPKINDTIKTILIPVNKVGKISVVKIETYADKNKISECSMTIILNE